MKLREMNILLVESVYDMRAVIPKKKSSCQMRNAKILLTPTADFCIIRIIVVASA
jgi:hypothetical protein